MDATNWVELIVAVLAVLGGNGFLQFIITRKDKKKSEIEDFKKEVTAKIEQIEAKNEERYLETKEIIDALAKAVAQLEKNDTSQSHYMRTMGESLIGLSHDRLISLCDKCLHRGYITLKEKTTINSIYEPYTALGGNGDCHVAYEEICKLPTISDEEARVIDIDLKKKGEI